MDLFLANLITAAFFIAGYKVIGRALLPKVFSVPVILRYSLLIFFGIAFSSMLFAFVLGLLLPETYPVTFSYKALVLTPVISLYFLYKMFQNRRQPYTRL